MLPSKVIPIHNSVLIKLPDLIEAIPAAPITVIALWDNCNDKFQDVSEFIFALEILYVLDRIDLIDDERIQKHA